MIKKIEVITQDRYQLIDVTDKIEEAVQESGIKDGLLFIFTPHSTAAILITENESGLNRDWLEFFKRQVSGIKFTHDPSENNGDSHILASLAGYEKTLIIKNGKIVSGKWQQIFFAEFDGPRKREVIIKMVQD